MPVRTLAIDVDNTLIDDSDELYPGVEAKLKEWKVRYTHIICWSHSGVEHAKRVCKKHKLDKFFTSFSDKPDVIVDDRPASIISFPAILHVVNPLKWWKQSDNDMFKNSRDWFTDNYTRKEDK